MGKGVLGAGGSRGVRRVLTTSSVCQEYHMLHNMVIGTRLLSDSQDCHRLQNMGGMCSNRVADPSDPLEDSVERLGVSGGSAAFFKLRLKSQSRPMDYFIGKEIWLQWQGR